MPKTTVEFFSPSLGLRLLRKPPETRLAPDNSVHTIAPEVVYEFDNGRLVLHPGKGMIADKWDPEKGEFVEQDCVEWALSHPDIDTRFHRLVPVAPDPAPVFAAIAEAVIAGDRDRLLAIGNEEHDTWNRLEIMQLVDSAMDKIDGPVTAKAG